MNTEERPGLQNRTLGVRVSPALSSDAGILPASSQEPDFGSEVASDIRGRCEDGVGDGTGDSEPQVPLGTYVDLLRRERRLSSRLNDAEERQKAFVSHVSQLLADAAEHERQVAALAEHSGLIRGMIIGALAELVIALAVLVVMAANGWLI